MESKKIYVNSLVEAYQITRPRNRKDYSKSKRCLTYKYNLRFQCKNIRVCKKFFLNTLDIGEKTVLNWIKKAIVSKPISKSTAQNKLTDKKQCLHEFFDALPSVESHYCRAVTQKKYLLPEWRSKRELYDFYVNNWCKNKNVQPLSITVFNKIFHQRNCGLFAPKKDQCEICARYSVGDLSYEEYTFHQEKKEETRTEKQKDKNEETHVFTVDLQAVLMAPKSNVSSLYYRAKLQVHNLVFFNLKTQKAYCFIWNEAEGGVNAEEFASIWVYFIEKKNPS